MPRTNAGTRPSRGRQATTDQPVTRADLQSLEEALQDRISALTAAIPEAVAEVIPPVIAEVVPPAVAEAVQAAIPRPARGQGGGGGQARSRRGGQGGGSTRGQVTYKAGIEKVLGRASGPLHAKVITQRVLKLKGVKTPEGATPEATIGAILATENAKPGGLVVRTAPATYKLRGQR